MSLKQSILFVLLPLLVACSSDDKAERARKNTISFAAKETITRAEYDSVSPDYHLYVSALLHTSGTKQYNEQVYKLYNPTAAASYWGTHWYWPPSGHISFMAWGGNCEIDPEWVSFTYTDGATLPSSREDITFASLSIDLAGRMDGTKDILYLRELDKTLCAGQTGSRHLIFNHATSCLSIALHAKDAVTAEHLGVFGVKLDNVPTSGRLTVNVTNPLSATGEYSPATPTWGDRQRTNDIVLGTFTATEENPIHLPHPDSIPDDLQQEQLLFVLPGEADADLTVNYTINGSPHAFLFPFTRLKKDNGDQEEWIAGRHHLYRFVVSLKEIEAGAMEEQWDTEIGGTAFEPEWSVEISTGAMETTWGVEIGGQGYEVTWRMEMSVSALESVWVSEMQASASENNWNTEIGSGAAENGWNQETSSTAEEEKWKQETGGTAQEEAWEEETGGTAYEAPWMIDEDEEEIIIE